jgi:hypothetical protein
LNAVLRKILARISTIAPPIGALEARQAGMDF